VTSTSARRTPRVSNGVSAAATSLHGPGRSSRTARDPRLARPGGVLPAWRSKICMGRAANGFTAGEHHESNLSAGSQGAGDPLRAFAGAALRGSREVDRLRLGGEIHPRNAREGTNP
jgi:hypothetical protein